MWLPEYPDHETADMLAREAIRRLHEQAQTEVTAAIQRKAWTKSEKANQR